MNRRFFRQDKAGYKAKNKQLKKEKYPGNPVDPVKKEKIKQIMSKNEHC